MAEETLYCPSCNQKVRVPEAMLGQPVQCPLCHLVFTAPVRGGAPPAPPLVPGQYAPGTPPPAAPQPQYPAQPPYYPGQAGPPDFSRPPREWSQEQQRGLTALRAAGIALLVMGVLELLWDLVVRVGSTYSAGPNGMARQMDEMAKMMPGLFDQKGAQALTPQTMYLLTMGIALFWTACSVAMIVAGIQMLRARAFGLAVLGSILGLLTLIDFPCCCLSVAISLWALITLFRPDVRNLFA